jgi:hypothetical protein
MTIDPSQPVSSDHGIETGEDARLDEALCQWRAQTTTTPQHLKVLQKSIEQAVATSKAPKVVSASDQQFAVVRFVLACAATCLIVAGGFWSYRVLAGNSSASKPSAGTDSQTLRGSDGLLKIATTDLESQQALLNGFRGCYGSQVQFVSEIDGRLQIRLDQQPSAAALTRRSFVAVHLVLVSRELNQIDATWQVVHRANLLAGQEHLVEITDPKTSLQLSLWALPVDSHRVNLDLQGRWDAAVPIQLSQSELEQIGQARSVFAVTSGDVEYRLYQTVLLLSGDDDQQISSVRSVNAEGES